MVLAGLARGKELYGEEHVWLDESWKSLVELRAIGPASRSVGVLADGRQAPQTALCGGQ